MVNRLEIDSVILKFRNEVVLQSVYLKSESGKVTGLLGRNGSGKSCLMKIIYGTMFPDDKSIRFNGTVILNNLRDPKLIRYLPQFGFIPISLTVKQIFSNFKTDFSDFITFFPEYEKYYNSRLKTLSGGERRVIEIFSILTSETKFCMLDEPFSQIMPKDIEIIQKLISREKLNKGIIISDHLFKYIVDISDSIYLINNGKVNLLNNISELETFGYAKFS